MTARALLSGLLAALALTACGSGASGTMPDLHPAIDDWPEARIQVVVDDSDVHDLRVKVAADPVRRARGLMGVEALPRTTGMLFVFPSQTDGGFWMRGTLIPLDIAFVSGQGVIVDTARMEPCEAEERDECPVYEPDEPYRLALEVQGGWLDERGVEAGDRLAWEELPAPE